MQIQFLSSKNYTLPKGAKTGDCILIDTGTELVIYDCGSEEHAKAVLDYMDQHGYQQAKFILSHNDADHFNGLPKLLEEDRISAIYTFLLLKYKKELLKRIGDGRKTARSIAEQILDNYDNIATLTGERLLDPEKDSKIVCPGVTIVGPNIDYMLDAVTKLLKNCESDTIDNETIINATSIQVSVTIGHNSLLLTGDASFPALEDKIQKYDAIQLPHHGKPEQAEKIFQEKMKQVSTIYVISDNTGNSKGGSDGLDTSGHRVYSTKDGNVTINSATFSTWNYSTYRCLGG